MAIRRNDLRDIDRGELKLIRIGQLLWLDRKKTIRAEDVQHIRVLDAALETVWQLKRERRAELKAERAAESARMRAFFAERKAA